MPQQLEAVPHQCRYACDLSVLIVLLSIAKQALNGLEIELRVSYVHRMQICRISDVHCTTIWPQNRAGMLIIFLGGVWPRPPPPPPPPPKCFCALCRSSYKRSVPMLCPSIRDVLATPLAPSPSYALNYRNESNYSNKRYFHFWRSDSMEYINQRFSRKGWLFEQLAQLFDN